jgi:RND superfamily putative drug exporter
MELLGDRNWWFPRWLDRLIPRLHVEAGPDVDAEFARLADEERAGVGGA